jgi:predicted transcriptional regulator
MTKLVARPDPMVSFYIEDLCEGVNISPRRLRCAIRSLEEKGFVSPTSERPILDGGTFRLTMFATADAPPTHDYMNWKGRRRHG